MGLIFRQGLSFSGFERDSLYLNLEGQKFMDVSGVSGIDSISDGRAAIVADFDNDGDLDVFLTAIQGEGHLLFRNNVGQDSHFTRITLEGNDSGKEALGAIVRVKTSRGIQTQLRSAGSGFLAQHDPRLLFGLGEDEAGQWLEITWPSGKKQRLGPIQAGASLKVVEGVDEYLTVSEPRATLPDPVPREKLIWHKLTLTKGGSFPPLPIYSLEGGQEAKPVRFKPRTSYFVNLWATWCGPCRKEMPELQKLAPRFRQRGIELVGLSVDQEVEPSTLRAFAEELGISYPLYRIDQPAFESLFAGEEMFVPLSILIDERGAVVDVFAGWSPESERRIRWLLE